MRSGCALLAMCGASCAISMQEIEEVIAAGPYTDNFTDIANRYRVPDWYVDGKFGFYTHWGVYSVPAYFSEWYPRDMYIEGNPVWKHQVATYGPMTVTNGYKEFIPHFKGEYFNATEWVDIFTKAGARWAGPVGEHCDGFAMYNCSISHWNAARMGPQRDVAGELRAAAQRAGLRFVVSSHRGWHSSFFDGARKLPGSDAYQCVCNGGGKAAMDPDYCTLYCPENTNETTPTDGFMQDWLLRTCEIIDLYGNDIMYFDSMIGYSPVWRPTLAKMAAFYYNKMHRAGKLGVINTKHTTMPPGTDVVDIERGAACAVRPDFWQTDTSISRQSWGYIEGDTYKGTGELLTTLVDIVSKNGALLLNVGPAANGSIPAAAKSTFLAMGDWLRENGEAIYGTRPYHDFGEGPTLFGCGTFAEGVGAFTPRDFRFTTKGNATVYAVAMGASGGDEVLVEALGGALVAGGAVAGVDVLGHGAAEWRVETGGLRVSIPPSAGRFGPPVLAVKGLSGVQWDGVVRQSADGALRLRATTPAALLSGATQGTAGNCTGALSGSTTFLGLPAGAAAQWAVRITTPWDGLFSVEAVVSSPGAQGDLTVQVGNASVVAPVPSTAEGQYATAGAPNSLRLRSGEHTLVVSAAARPVPPPQGAHWVSEAGVNYFSGCAVDNSTWLDLGRLGSAQDCAAACRAAAGCQAYTWHDEHQGYWATFCAGRTDGHYGTDAQDGHFSGRLNCTTATASCSATPPTVRLSSLTLRVLI
eukprot:TRINITY_DN3946_c0_g1_i1.p1 TRINITY_DN3946_c0_g1~~TRINITY_DN3946_c0_g1_i1.p1  ORF type:complete len:754 (+),score=195.27 TRINITY_DN3946_c0_g1_i1:95-2356(+)